MAIELDERHWYQFSGWKRLRTKTMMLAMSYADDFLDHLSRDGCDSEQEIDHFVGNIIAALGAVVRRDVRDPEIRSRIGAGADITSSMWPFALSLFGDIGTLTQAIAKGLPVLSGKRIEANEAGKILKPRPALYQILKTFLEHARRQQSPATLHRQSVWERVDIISRRLAREHDGSHLAHRTSLDHIRLVQREIKVKHPSDKNLNMSLGNLQGYFDEFLENVEELNYFESGADDSFDADASPDETHRQLIAFHNDFGFWPPVELCLNKLKLARRELWEAFVIDNRLKDIDLTQQAYLEKANVTRYALEGRSRDAAGLLRKCLDDSVLVQNGRRS